MRWWQILQRRVLTVEVTKAAFSALVGATIASLFQIATNWLFEMLIIATLCFIIIAVLTIATLSSKFDDQFVRTRLSVNISYTRGAQDKEPDTYKALQQVISRARTSVDVISLARRVDLEGPQYRKDYYQMIHTLLSNRLNSGENFRYRRILQVKEVAPSGVLKQHMVDPVVYRHCRDILTLSKSGGVSVILQQVEEHTCPVSFLIIDDVEVIILIPPIMPHQNTEVYKHLGMGLFFSDNTVALVNEMRRTFSEVSALAYVVNSTDDSAAA